MQLRLTNKRLEEIAVRKLFERVTLYAHWQSGGKDVAENVTESSVDGLPTNLISASFSYEIRDMTVGVAHVSIRRTEAEGDDADGPVAASDEEENDEIVAASNLDNADLSPTGNNDTDPRSQKSSGETSGHSPQLDPFIEDEPSNEAGFVTQSLEEWEASACRPQWARENFPGPSDYDAAVFLNILDNERLRGLVKKVEVYTCETHCVS